MVRSQSQLQTGRWPGDIEFRTAGIGAYPPAPCVFLARVLYETWLEYWQGQCKFLCWPGGAPSEGAIKTLPKPPPPTRVNIDDAIDSQGRLKAGVIYMGRGSDKLTNKVC